MGAVILLAASPLTLSIYGGSATRAAAAEASSPARAAQNQLAQQVGTVQAIHGNVVTLTTDRGAEISVQMADNAKMVLVAPGQKDLKNATPIQLTDLRAGDRILVRGQASADGKSFTAIGLIAMSQSDLQARRQQEAQEWQRGIGGLVKQVDPNTGTIVISVAGMAATKTVVIHATKDTALRRYAPDSILFDDAKPAGIEQIKPGDQLRARGTRSADGNEFTADEIVSGTFRNIAGTVLVSDKDAGTVTVQDSISKKPVVVRITSQSQLRILPPELAQRLAFRFKRTAGGANEGNSASPNPSAGQGGQHSAWENSRAAHGRQSDLQELLNRIPPATIADFPKGEAVLVVSTEGAASGEVTAITMVGGVEPILTAAPSGSQGMTLSPWSLGASPAVGGADDTQ